MAQADLSATVPTATLAPTVVHSMLARVHRVLMAVRVAPVVAIHSPAPAVLDTREIHAKLLMRV